jgi:hypothetical protein
LRDIGDLPAHLGDQLAIVLHFGHRETVNVTGDEVTEPAQQVAALRGIERRPFAAVEGPAGGIDGAINVTRISFRDARPDLRRERIEGIEELA